MSTHGADRLHFGLLENGLDFVAKALEELQGDPTARNLKYTVLHLKAGIDLLLKERLRQHDWRQLFAEVSTADEDRLASGAFTSPGTSEVLRRLRDEAGVVVASRHKTNLDRLGRLRNRIEHFAVSDSTEAVVALSAKALAFAVDFVSAEIEPNGMDGRAAELLDEIRDALKGSNAFVAERRRAIRPELDRFDVILDCYRCGEPSFTLDEGGHCHFCGYEVDAAEGAAEYAWLVLGSTEYDVSKGGEWAVTRCPECYSETLVDTGAVGSEAPALRWACFTCGSGWKEDALDHCSSCGGLHASDSDICSDCWEYKLSAD